MGECSHRRYTGAIYIITRHAMFESLLPPSESLKATSRYVEFKKKTLARAKKRVAENALRRIPGSKPETLEVHVSNKFANEGGERTYDEWHVPILGGLSDTSPHFEESLKQAIVETVEAEDESENNTANDAAAQDKGNENIESSLDTLDATEKVHLLIAATNEQYDEYLLRNGLEVAPGGILDSEFSIPKQHMRALSTLLHFNIMREKWDLAYQITCTLVRSQYVDTRTIWPLAVEVLMRRRELSKELSVSFVKEERFLEWLILMFPPLKTNLDTSRPPVYRPSTRFLLSKITLTSLWMLLVEENYTKLRERLEELALGYSHEPVIPFLVILNNLAECICLANRFTTFDDDPLFEKPPSLGDWTHDTMLMCAKDQLRLRAVNLRDVAFKAMQECNKLSFVVPDTVKREFGRVDDVFSEETPLEFELGAAMSSGATLSQVANLDSSIEPALFSKSAVRKANVASRKRPWFYAWIEPNGLCTFCGHNLSGRNGSYLREHMYGHEVYKDTVFSDLNVNLGGTSTKTTDDGHEKQDIEVFSVQAKASSFSSTAEYLTSSTLSSPHPVEPPSKDRLVAPQSSPSISRFDGDGYSSTRKSTRRLQSFSQMVESDLSEDDDLGFNTQRIFGSPRPSTAPL